MDRNKAITRAYQLGYADGCKKANNIVDVDVAYIYAMFCAVMTDLKYDQDTILDIVQKTQDKWVWFTEEMEGVHPVKWCEEYTGIELQILV